MSCVSLIIAKTMLALERCEDLLQAIIDALDEHDAKWAHRHIDTSASAPTCPVSPPAER